MKDAASKILGETVEAGIWLQTYKPRWYHNFTTGSEIDLLILAALLPGILISQLFQKQQMKNGELSGHSGLIFCATTPTRIAFIGAKSKWIGRELVGELCTQPRSEILDLAFNKEHNTPVTFRFADLTIDLFFSGIWSDLADFKSKTMSNFRDRNTG